MERGYTIIIPDELRKAIYMQAAGELEATAADVARRWLEIGRRVQEAGFATLEEFCSARHIESIGAWVGGQDHDS